jgi:hypothetical protein
VGRVHTGDGMIRAALDRGIVYNNHTFNPIMMGDGISDKPEHVPAAGLDRPRDTPDASDDPRSRKSTVVHVMGCKWR